jgi:4-phosphopantoate--beta-alanine ligase
VIDIRQDVIKRMKIPKSHPRYESLKIRHMLVEGLQAGYVTESGLIAHGRGEAFDYLLGERTVAAAAAAEKAAVAALLLAKRPVISVNGNTAALVPDGLVDLAKAVGAKLEVNLFYRTEERENLISKVLLGAGAEQVLGVGDGMKKLARIDSDRARADPDGIWTADVVLVPLEDGDRAEALAEAGKLVISVDLNPLSRTSQAAAVPIVDNVVRAVPNMIRLAEKMKSLEKVALEMVLGGFDREKCLSDAISVVRKGV